MKLGLRHPVIKEVPANGGEPAAPAPERNSFVIEIAFIAISLALVLASETILMARVAAGVSTLLLFVGTQLFVCVVLLLATKRLDLFEHMSPTPVCVLFLLGVAWILATTELITESLPTLAVSTFILPSAVLLGVGNAITGYFLIDYCRRTPPERFASVAIGGSAAGSVLCYVVAYLLPGASGALCGVLALAWYIVARATSQLLAERQTYEPDSSGQSGKLGTFIVATLVFCVSCGLLPSIVFENGRRLEGTNVVLFAVSMLVIATILIAASWTRCGKATIVRVATLSTVIVAGGYLLSVTSNQLLSLVGASVVCVFQLICASVMVYLYANYAGNPKEHPLRFWGTQVLVLAVTGAATAGGMAAAQGASEVSSLWLVLIAMYALLAFLAAFLGAWVTPAKGQAAMALKHNEKSDLVSRCRDLSEQGHLTKRESQALELMARGWTTDMISHRMAVSPGTVRTHIKHLYTKLGIHSRNELMALLGMDAIEIEGEL